MLTHAKENQARIIGQIQKSYSNAGGLLRPIMNQVEFEKAIKKDETRFYFDNIIKSFTSDSLSEIEKVEGQDKVDLIKKSHDQVSSLEKIDIVFDSIVKSVYVDVIDVETYTYKDNEINRILDRVGKSTK